MGEPAMITAPNKYLGISADKLPYIATELEQKNATLTAENAKLRKMVEEMHPFAKAYMSDAMIFGCVDDKSFGWEMCMRELGIEVKG
jgi:hypothetical protein